MKTVSVRTLQHDLARILSWIESGENVQITKRNRAVAQLSPVQNTPKVLSKSQIQQRWTKPRPYWKSKSINPKDVQILLDSRHREFES